MNRALRSAVKWMERTPVRSWRFVLLLYGVALTVGTHWPSLRVSGPGGFPIDKVLHVIAFAGLAGFLMLARLTGGATRAFERRNILLAALIAVVWAAIDEWTQSAAALDRFARLDDYIADLAGILIATVVALACFARLPFDES